jgi:hypothetical protein
MKGTKLVARVMIRNLQNTHEKLLPSPPTEARGPGRMELEYQDQARLQGRGPHTGGRNLNGRLLG